MEKTDLIEMWGNFIGEHYTHRRYGPNRHSLFGIPVFDNSWYAVAERELFFDETNPTASKIHIPKGFLHDLIDDNAYNQNSFLVERNLNLTDLISGYSISTIYNYLDGSTKSPAALMDKLSTQLPTGADNTITNFSLLRNGYGY